VRSLDVIGEGTTIDISLHRHTSYWEELSGDGQCGFAAATKWGDYCVIARNPASPASQNSAIKPLVGAKSGRDARCARQRTVLGIPPRRTSRAQTAIHRHPAVADLIRRMRELEKQVANFPTRWLTG